MIGEAHPSALKITLDERESALVRRVEESQSESIVLPGLYAILSAEPGVDSVSHADGVIDIGFSTDVGPATAHVALSFVGAAVENAARFAAMMPAFDERGNDRWLARYWPSQSSVAVVSTYRLLYSDPHYVVFDLVGSGYVMVAFIAKEGPIALGHGDKGWTKQILKLIDASRENDTFVRAGLGARGIEGMDLVIRKHVHSVGLERAAEEANAALLADHGLADGIDPGAKLWYVDKDLILGERPGGFCYLCYRREGFFEKRDYEGAARRRIVAAAARGMAENRPDNSFRKWVVKQDYGFDVAA